MERLLRRYFRGKASGDADIVGNTVFDGGGVCASRMVVVGEQEWWKGIGDGGWASHVSRVGQINETASRRVSIQVSIDQRGLTDQ